jgi:hypothetical protein
MRIGIIGKARSVALLPVASLRWAIKSSLLTPEVPRAWQT